MKARWQEVKLGDVLQLANDEVPVEASESYNIAGVYSFGRGLFKRGPLSGSETTYKCFHRLHPGQLVVSQLKAWEGAIALITSEYEGWHLSPQFPTFRVNEEKADARFIKWFCRRASFWKELEQGARGMGARRNSVPPRQFLGRVIPLPPLPEQRRIVAGINQIVSRMDKTLSLKAKQETEIKSALLSAFHRISSQAPRKPMREVAPQVRRPQKVQPLENYPELGIRSFGHGTFHKPTLTGFEIGDKRIFQIEPGDLLFSNVFAWEGAIAVARPEDAGRVGSHRYITCVPRPTLVTSSFLRFYFLTSEGLEKIGAASPGGAGRNRTLGLKALDEIDVPVPSMKAQLWFDDLQLRVNDMENVQSQSIAELHALLPSILDSAFEGRL